MKARIFIAAMLILSLATFAQNSRRGLNEGTDVQRRSNNNANNQNERSRTYNSPKIANTNHRENQTNTVSSNENHSHSAAITSSSTRRGPDYMANRDNNRQFNENTRMRVTPTGYRGRDIEGTAFHRPDYWGAHVYRERSPYRRPINTEIFWSVNMHRDYLIFYPEVHWSYPIGHRIVSIPAYDASEYVGEVANIYGKVVEVYYANENDEYYLYFGDYYPNQEFSIVLPGREARLFNYDPERYFENQHVTVTGYLTNNDGKPEILVRKANQVEIY